MNETDIPVLDPSTFPAEYKRASSSVRGILLAAGMSSRYGEENKLLQTVDGTPVVRNATETLLKSDVNGVTVVIGYEAAKVRATVDNLDVTFQTNNDYTEGQSTSVYTGIADANRRDIDAALIALGDMPWVTSETVNRLVDAYRRGVSDILVAAHEGKRGNPVLFDSRFFNTLTDVDGDIGGRRLLFESNDTVAIEMGDAGVVRDIDHPVDLPD